MSTVETWANTDDLGLDRLSNGGVDNCARGAGKIGGDGDLGWNDIGILGDRNRVQGQCASNSGDYGYDDGEPRSVDKDRGEH